MRKVLHKVKSQWVVLGVMGAAVINLGTTNIPQVSAAEMEGTGVTEATGQSGNELVTNDTITFSTEETAIEEVPYVTVEVADSNLEKGKTEVRQVGVNGTQKNTYAVTYTDGLETNRTLLTSVVTTTPTEEIIAVGTKDVTAPIIDNSSISILKLEVTEGEPLSVSVNITDASEIESASIDYISPITGQIETIILHKNEINGLFEGELTVTSTTEFGTWKCNKIEAIDINGNSAALYHSNSDLSGADFTVNETLDAIKSATEASSVEPTQALANSGESVPASEKATDEMEVFSNAEIARVEMLSMPTINLAPLGTLSSSAEFDGISYITDAQTENTEKYANGAQGLQWIQMDLGAAHDLEAINLWHYYGDGRSYRDVVVQLSNDGSFSGDVVTVFNNDKDGSAGLGAGTDSEYSETSSGKAIAFDAVNARYARFYSNGSNVNGWNHYVEIKVYGSEPQATSTVNLATKGTLSSSAEFDGSSYITDAQTGNAENYANGAQGLQWVQMDLGASYDLEAINLWHYYGDGRSYHDVVVQLSNDASFSNDVVTVFNNDKDGSAGLDLGTDSEYSETSSGKTIAFDAVNARYARFYSNGSNVNGWNHYVEIKVYGSEPQATSTVNLAPLGTLSSSAEFDGISYITDAQTANTENYANGAQGLQWVQMDLGASYDLEAINLWHYYGDGRSYRDVVVQLSNDGSFSGDVVTVFNNDKDGSAGLGAGTDSEYSETSSGKAIAFDAVNARYARFYSNGSNVNGWNHYVEIKVYGSEPQATSTVNLATKGTLSSSAEFDGSSYITDAQTGNAENYANGAQGLQWVQMDLGASYDLEAINLWHYYGDGRSYHDVVVQLSNDASFSNDVVTTVFNNDKDGSAGLGLGTDSEYSETSSGKTIAFDAVNARYARFYSNGSNVNGWNHYVEIKVYGSEPMKTEVRTETTTENLVDYTTINTEDNTLKIGETELIQGGFNGYDTVTYSVTYINGVETGRVETNRTTIAPVQAIVRVGTQVIETKTETVVENTVGYTTVNQEDNTFPSGQTEVIQAGVDGYDTVTYAVTYTNGVETGRVETSRTTTAPVQAIVRVGTQVTEVKSETTIENEVAYVTIEEFDNTIPTSERVVVQTGLKGYDTVTYEVTYVNGVETNRVEVSRVTTAPVTEIVKVGTQVTEVKTETTTENELAFTTVEEEDSTIPTGDRVVVQAGVNGFDTVMFDVTFVNGVETNRIEVSRTTTAPVNEIIKVGTQVTEVKTEMTTENEVTYATVEEFDNTIPTGERVVVKAGEKGYDTVNYDVTYVNGIETNRVEISRETIAPVSEIVKVGTQVTEVKSETATENEVGFATVEEFDNTIPTGERVVAQTGVNGFDTVTYAVTFVNGIETNRVEVSRTTTAPVSEIVKVGTKISVSDIFVTSKDIDSIILNSSILQMTASISPDTATVTDVTWSVDSGTGTASIDSTGLLTAMSAGTVTVKATANDGSKVVGTQKIEIASPITITSYNGSNLGIVIPEVLEYGNYGDYSVGERLNYGEKGIVTSIGFKAMYNKQLTSVVMPESVTQIGDSAFGSNQLISIVIPKNVTSIGEYAFGYNQLISAVIPPSVTSIGSDAFRGNQLTFVVIPESLTSIGDGAFGFNQLTSIVIPSMVTSIGSYAFTGNELTSVIIPESVISIGSSAFWDNKITNVVIPGNVTSIGHGAFLSNGLTSVVIPENLINIASYLFSGNKLTSVVIPSNVTSIGFNAFANNELASIIIPEKVTSIGSYAFWDNNLTNIVIPVKVTDIGSYAFWRNQLTSVLIPSSVTAIGGYAFQSNQLTNIFIPDSMKFIGSGAFSQNQITSITIGEGVQIGDNLLASNNYFRTAYTIGGAGTYSGTQDGEWIKIQEITVEEHNLTSKENVVDYKRVQQEDNTFPAGQMEVIQEGVDGYDTVTYEVKYTNGVETGRTETRRTTTAPVDEIVRVGTQETVKSITVSAAGDTSIVLNGEQLQMSAIATPEDATEVSVIWSVEDGSGKATIDEYGLLIATESGTVTVKATAKDGLGALGIKEISVAVPVKVIDYAGDDTSIEIPEIIIGNQKGGGGDYEGIYISNLLDYDEIGIVTDIEGYAFFNCYLTSVVIPSNVTSIGSYAFRYNKLSSVVIPENVTSIGAYAFSTNQLVSVLISGSVTDIGSYAFYSNQLSSVIIPESVVNIGSYAFCYNELSNVVISEGVTNIGSCAFYDNQLTNIVIPESVTSIGSSAFSSNKLTRITIGEGVMIGDNLLGGSGNNHFRNAYEIGGAGSYVGTQSGYWTKIS